MVIPGTTVLRFYREVQPNVGQTKPTKLRPLVRYIFWRRLLTRLIATAPLTPLAFDTTPTPGVGIHRRQDPHAAQELLFSHRVNNPIGRRVV